MNGKAITIGIFGLLIISLMSPLTSTSVEIDTKKVGVVKGNTFIYNITKLVGLDSTDISITDDASGLKVNIGKGDIFEVKVLSDEIDSKNQLKTSVSNDAATQAVLNSMDSFNAFILFTDWDFWESDIPKGNSGILSADANITIDNDVESFQAIFTLSVDIPAESQNFIGYKSQNITEIFVYDKETGVCKQFEKIVNTTYLNGSTIVEQSTMELIDIVEGENGVVSGFEFPAVIFAVFIVSVHIIKRKKSEI